MIAIENLANVNQMTIFIDMVAFYARIRLSIRQIEPLSKRFSFAMMIVLAGRN